MPAVELPDPRVQPGASLPDDRALRGLERELRRRVDGEVRFDAGSRGAYATDSSNYRIPPIGVVVPRTVEAAVEAVAVCRERGVPLVSRGGGTSLAGQTANAAVVLDWSKYCTGLVSLDVEARRCVVEPGIALDILDGSLSEHGLRWGPQPATHWTSTIGGMIGNNTCGATAQRYGKVSDNIARMEVLLYDGTRMWVGPTTDEEYARIQRGGGRRAEVYRQLREIRDRHLEDFRTGFPQIPRRVSGYNLDALLPEHGFDLARALVGSEGTLVTVLHAELALSELPGHRRLVVLGYPDIVSAGRAVPSVLTHRPHRLEGVDRILVRNEREMDLRPETIESLPEGAAWLLVELTGRTEDETAERVDRLVDDVCSSEVRPTVDVVVDPHRQEQLWVVRESGLAATAHPPVGKDAWPGWEDSAVAPERLGDYLADLRGLLNGYGFDSASLYGHFGHGCVHVRVPFRMRTEGGTSEYRRFLEDAASLVVEYGGSLSGEHGDGQARGELLDKMFPSGVIRAFAEVKSVLDPDNRMNPGKVVAPYALDENLRVTPGYPPWEPETVFGFPEDGGSFAQAALRCVGVGKCRNRGEPGMVMCPSYQVTGEEEHSTRGRARLLYEMVKGDVVTDRWRSRAVHDALDLCLACKGCKSDCPVDVDMATYKAEFLHHHYKRRIRPVTHYSMGWLPGVVRVAQPAARAFNALTRAPGLRRVAALAAGVDRRRQLPLIARQRFSHWYRDRGPQGDGARGDVLLWPDTFTEFFHPHIGMAAVRVLEDAGFRVRLPDREVCCGLTLISTGQLTLARQVLRRTVETFRPALDAGIPVVGLEPSCTAVLRADAHDLMPEDEDVRRLQEATRTLGELLEERAPDWSPPAAHRRALVQTHCHQHAIMGTEADTAVMRRAGLTPEILDTGCCGLAGNFGFERGHYDVSIACAERALLPRLRESDPRAVVVADGFSCRTQIEQGEVGRRAVHLAEVLAGLVDGVQLGDLPERVLADRVPLPASRGTGMAEQR